MVNKFTTENKKEKFYLDKLSTLTNTLHKIDPTLTVKTRIARAGYLTYLGFKLETATGKEVYHKNGEAVKTMMDFEHWVNMMDILKQIYSGKEI